MLVALLLWSARLTADPGGRRGDDLLYVLVGIVPGAVVGGRLFHAVAFADAYVAQPTAIFDLSRGSLSLVGAVIGGTVSGAYVCRLLGYSVPRWAGAAAVPLLLAVGFGKLGMLLGGAGQGAPFDGPWAVAFTGAGPWVSPDPAAPAHPSQAYEGLWALAGIPALWRLVERGWSPPPAGLFLGALGWWLAGRSVVAVTWRDERVIGPVGVEQALGLVVLAGTLVLLFAAATRRPRATA